MQKVDAEIRKILDTQYALARNLIETERDKVEAIAQALLEWETIYREQLDDIMDGRPPRPPKDWTPTLSRSNGAPPVKTDGAPAAA
jgi:cell division protease FtsH